MSTSQHQMEIQEQAATLLTDAMAAVSRLYQNGKLKSLQIYELEALRDLINVELRIRDKTDDPIYEQVKNLKSAMLKIAAYDHDNNGCCPFGCDTPDIAREALEEAA